MNMSAQREDIQQRLGVCFEEKNLHDRPRESRVLRQALWCV
jgi:hypothetical protein